MKRLVMRSRTPSVVVILAIVAVLDPGRLPAGDVSAGPDPAALEAQVLALIDEHAEGAVASVWVGGPDGTALFALDPDAARPSASAIKTAYLVVLFSRYADDLDASPPGLDEALADDHPAMAPYTPAQRDEIRGALRGASARSLGGIMMGSIDAPNHVYNAAASAVTALFGGPEALTEAIHALDPTLAPIASRRYMLAPRDVTGDNEASAAALASVMRMLAVGEVPGAGPGTVEAIRGAILAEDEHLGLDGQHQFKGGSLNTDPMARVRSGWWEAPGAGPIAYAVILSRPGPGDLPRAEAGDRLEEAAAKVTAMVLEAARGGGPGG
ncbi:serine hydrolase [Tautonia plasticadhaerens]|uniref:Beta-lactamase n=1 Tax=Tautonia plasticadhaerens TaxID=2527974 RepID=A0A518H3H6_9BACT|nr:serine hydrolase [Tautonia plasticadhaerens]QDV35389.1 hypothetical protein ElP_32920 [Tautonia plasticadhaerens]